MKRILFFVVCFFSFTLFIKGQVGIKTNVLMDATKTINLGIEFGMSKRTTLDLSGNYNPWSPGEQKMFKMLMVQPEVRYWFCDRFNGHFVGIHLHGGVYNVAGVDLPFGIWNDLEENRYKGHFYGAGVSYGYQWILGKHWNIEAGIGVGYVRAQYEKYPCKKCGKKLGEGHKNYVGPTKAAVSLIYLF